MIYYSQLVSRFTLQTLGAALLLLLMLLVSSTLHAKDAELWPYWQKSNASSEATIEHSAWDKLLKKHVKHNGTLNRFDYAGVTSADKNALKQYIQKLEKTTITNYNRTEQEAFWTNLYNAVTIDVVLDNYPVDSIKDIDISPGLFSSGPWGKDLVTVEGKAMSLDDIEHRILRPIWNTPLTHYTVNCASIGCPNLHTDAFTGENIKSLQVQLAKDFINSPRGAQVKQGDLEVSKIYKWFEADFGGSEKAVIAHLTKYANADLKSKLSGITDIDSYEYDWSLNR